MRAAPHQTQYTRLRKSALATPGAREPKNAAVGRLVSHVHAACRPGPSRVRACEIADFAGLHRTRLAATQPLQAPHTTRSTSSNGASRHSAIM